jgi:hypothetical protein
MCVILDDNEVSSDEDEPLQKRRRQFPGDRPAVRDEAATMTSTADKEATNKRAVEEATEEAAAAEEAAGKTVGEGAGATGGSPAPGQVPSVAGAKRAASPSGSTPPAKRPYRGVWKPQFVPLSILFCVWLHSLIILFTQVLSLRRGHRDGHGCRRCCCRGDSEVRS